jgi:hypothetical protein
MAGPNVTLSDIYMKLEEIEERIERLESIMGRMQRASQQVQQPQAPKPQPSGYHYMEKSRPSQPQQAPVSQREKEPVFVEGKNKEINIKNWRYLLGLE